VVRPKIRGSIDTKNARKTGRFGHKAEKQNLATLRETSDGSSDQKRPREAKSRTGTTERRLQLPEKSRLSRVTTFHSKALTCRTKTKHYREKEERKRRSERDEKEQGGCESADSRLKSRRML